MNPLKTFYGNEPEREDFKTFQIEMLRSMAADKAIEGEDTKGIKDAMECVIKSFDKLEELYGKIEPVIINNSR